MPKGNDVLLERTEEVANVLPDAALDSAERRQTRVETQGPELHLLNVDWTTAMLLPRN